MFRAASADEDDRRANLGGLPTEWLFSTVRSKNLCRHPGHSPLARRLPNIGPDFRADGIDDVVLSQFEREAAMAAFDAEKR
jgi:hypothetical protein